MSSIQLGELILLRPVWLIAAIALMIAAIRWHRVPIGSDWKKVLSDPVFTYLHGADHKDSRGNLALWAAALISLALAQPAVRKTDDDTWRHSIGWIAVVDVSRSMTLDDIVPYRLSAAREALVALSRESGARPIALVVYAGDAYLVAPPAFDKSIFDEHAALLAYNIVPTDGSNLARALSLTSSVVAESQLVTSRVFVLSDTGGINQSAIAAAGYLANQGHRLDVLVFGSSENTQKTLADTDASLRINDARLLAKAGNGISVQANPFGVIDFDKLKLRERASASTTSELHTLVWQNQSIWLLLLALPVFLLMFNRGSRI